MSDQTPPFVVDDVLAALAEPSRRRLLGLLASNVATASSLAESLPITRQAIVKHLGILEHAGLVVSTRSGREVRYTVQPEALITTANWMCFVAANWDRQNRRLTNINHAAEAPSRLSLTDP